MPFSQNNKHCISCGEKAKIMVSVPEIDHHVFYCRNCFHKMLPKDAWKKWDVFDYNYVEEMWADHNDNNDDGRKYWTIEYSEIE